MNNTIPDPEAPVVAWLAREETDYVIELSREDIADTFADLEYTDPDGNTVKLIGQQRILEMSDAEINVFVRSLWDMTEDGDWSWDMTRNISIAFESLQASLYNHGDIAGARLSFHAIAPNGKTEFPPTMLDELEMYHEFVDGVAELLDSLEDSGADASHTELVTSLREQINKLAKQQTNTSDDASQAALVASLRKQIANLTKQRNS